MQKFEIEEPPPPATNGTFFKRFLKAMTPSRRAKEAFEVVSLIVATIVTLCINALPMAVFFTVQVSACTLVLYFVTQCFTMHVDLICVIRCRLL